MPTISVNIKDLEGLLGAPVRPLDPSLVPHDFHCGYLVAPAVGAG